MHPKRTCQSTVFLFIKANGKSNLAIAQAKCLGPVLRLLSFSHTQHQICQEMLTAPHHHRTHTNGTTTVNHHILVILGAAVVSYLALPL